ncbi:hypothetical protein BV898_19445 [Hypsibius exemplaris]|uniref:DUF659 domain-containing protein n=1 Tax=Hypsibius exemplaris TaxID=2072580 RepID=A0A9X6NJ92_HYPEX|nr:hypothetical protein BV898_19445 [Hypsibius exemplaris]
MQKTMFAFTIRRNISTHYVDCRDHKTQHMSLACRSFPSPRAAEAVFKAVDEILAEWGPDYRRISTIITDNGSNMVAAFKDFDEDYTYLS